MENWIQTHNPLMILKNVNTYCYGFKIRPLGFSEVNSKTTFENEKFETERITQ